MYKPGRIGCVLTYRKPSHILLSIEPSCCLSAGMPDTPIISGSTTLGSAVTVVMANMYTYCP